MLSVVTMITTTMMRKIHIRLQQVTALLLVAGVLVDGSFIPQGCLPSKTSYSSSFSLMPPRTCTRLPFATRARQRQLLFRDFRLDSKDDDNDEDDNENRPGMAEAFRELESLTGSLDEDDDDDSRRQKPTVKKSAFEPPAALVDKPVPPSIENVSPEEEVQMYKDMVKELEDQDEDDLYSDVLADMGASVSSIARRKPAPKSSSTSRPAQPSIDMPSQATTSTSMSPNEKDSSSEEFMNRALEEALKEVKVNNPDLTDSILDDKEIMKEIEAIFEQGNEKLMQSLEEIRQEQKELAKASATKNAQMSATTMEEEAERLWNAEKSMATLLERVNQETAQVEKAVQELKAAQEEMDKDFIVKLKKGGIVKQSALVGFVLFSVRSILDTVASFSDESHFTAALVQGAIALACAAVFFLT